MSDLTALGAAPAQPTRRRRDPGPHRPDPGACSVDRPASFSSALATATTIHARTTRTAATAATPPPRPRPWGWTRAWSRRWRPRRRAERPRRRAPATTAAKVIAEAKKYLGVKYIWGGESPTGFDCSGLDAVRVQEVRGQPAARSRRTRRTPARPSAPPNAKPGDLVFFHNPATHVGIYLGNGMMLDSPNSKSVVRVEKVWSGVSGYRRVLPDSAFSDGTASASA